MNFEISIDMSFAVEFFPKNLTKFPSGSSKYYTKSKEEVSECTHLRKRISSVANHRTVMMEWSIK